MKKRIVLYVATFAALLVLPVCFSSIHDSVQKDKETTAPVQEKRIERTEIQGAIGKGETLSDIFKRYKLNFEDLLKLKEASASLHPLRSLSPGQPYKIVIDSANHVCSFIYWVDDENILHIDRTDTGFCAEKRIVAYAKKTLQLSGRIKDNLISSVGQGREGLMVALQLSDIFSWDIDFTSDLRNGDEFKIIVEGFYLDGNFKKYGDILAAEFTNDGKTSYAYRFEHEGNTAYYDAKGKPLRKAFLRAPLSFRRISSYFSKGRFHPILKIRRPHHGIDYAAPAGTPVSAIGDGTITFAGRKGQYGNLVITTHQNGYITYYGHLSRFGKGIRRGVKVSQGDVIGYVGSTGLATGPHLHYEMRVQNKPVDPLTVKLQGGTPIPKQLMSRFHETKSRLDTQLASIVTPVLASVINEKGKEK